MTYQGMQSRYPPPPPLPLASPWIGPRPLLHNVALFVLCLVAGPLLLLADIGACSMALLEAVNGCLGLYESVENCEDIVLQNAEKAPLLFLVGLLTFGTAVVVNRRRVVRPLTNIVLLAIVVGTHVLGFWLIATMPEPPTA